jgi:predicted methyltransferase
MERKGEVNSTDEIEIAPELCDYVLLELLSYTRDGIYTDREVAERIVRNVVDKFRHAQNVHMIASRKSSSIPLVAAITTSVSDSDSSA